MTAGTENDSAAAADPLFSDAEVEEFETVDKGAGKAICLMLVALFSLFVPLMLSFWLGVDTVSFDNSDKKAPAAASDNDAAGH